MNKTRFPNRNFFQHLPCSMLINIFLLILIAHIQISTSILNPSWRQTFALSSLAAEGLQFEEEPEIDSSLVEDDVTDSLPSTVPTQKRKDLRDPSKNDWSKLMNGHGSFECHKIPSNMSLCANIGYDKMILPNYLQHEEINEVISQSAVWLTLVKTECNLDITKFLCSLYAPVCIEGHEDNLILPCRSLCESVKEDCLPKMLKFGFSWPDIVNCSRFPELSNNMCIPKSQKKNQEVQCVGCQENQDIVKVYCKSDFAIRARIGNVNRRNATDGTQIISFWAALLGGKPLKREINERFIPIQVDCFCDNLENFIFKEDQQNKLGRWLIMGRVTSGPNQSVTYKATYMVPLSVYSYNTRNTLRRIAINKEGVCTNPNLMDPSQESDSNFQNHRIGRRRRRNRAERFRRNEHNQLQTRINRHPQQYSTNYNPQAYLHRQRRRYQSFNEF